MLAHSNNRRQWALGRRGSTRARRAFTIIELVVVLVLIGIVSAVVAPAILNSMQSDSIDTMTAPAITLLRFAQRTAAQQDQPVAVTIDPSTNNYQAQTSKDGIIRSSGTLVFPTHAHFLTDSARLQVVFNPTGSAVADSLVLSDAKNVAVVQVDPWTGAIHVTHR